ncbi:hypothetical protein RND81_06G130600 [Saponaria officinalis]|uniref:GAG-pre-integrase domain-containing protein n=1 Tax=Saponaria officinalis TaxID=3572 RepID=A0AAW1KAP3_SAPOF
MIEVSDPLYLHPSESPHSIVADTKLTGTICTKRKMRILTRVTTKPRNDPLREDAFNKCNNLPIKRSIMYISTAKGIWEYLQKTFFVSNGARKFMLNKTLDELNQGDKSISEYFTELRILWQNLEIMSDWPPITIITPEFSTFLGALHKEQEEKRLFQFLNRLDNSYSTMWSNLLMMNPLPTVEEAASLFMQKETQRRNVSSSVTMEVEGSAVFVNKKENDIPTCTICLKKRHLKEACWKVVGYPSNQTKFRSNTAKPYSNTFKGSKSWLNKAKRPSGFGRGSTTADAQVADYGSNVTLSAEHFEQMVNSRSTHQQESNSYLVTEDELDANFADITSNFTDSGASDHMISDLEKLENKRELVCKPKINLPNGQISYVSHIGTHKLKNGLILKNVLFVPSFNHNLLSVQKLARDEGCVVTFYETMCGLEKEHRGVYHLLNNPLTKLTPPCVNQHVSLRMSSLSNNVSSSKISTSDKKFPSNSSFWSCKVVDDSCTESLVINGKMMNLWHYRLGHVSNDKLKHLPNLSPAWKANKNNVCLTCPMAKFTKLPFSTRQNTTQKPWPFN